MGATARRRCVLTVWSFVAAIVLATAPCSAWAAPAEERQAAIGFSNLVARIDNADEIGIAGAEYRVHILEALRAAGLNAVGAESLVFSRDDSDKADFILGGTVKELECRYQGADRVCRVGILWEVLNRRSDDIVYRVLTRRVEGGLSAYNAAASGKRLVLGAVASLIARPRFRALLVKKDKAKAAQDEFPAAQFRACEAPGRELPAAFDAVADATVVLKDGDGFGSGFFLGSEGLILTAAHVVADGDVDAQERSGKVTRARTIRVSRSHDIALLSIAGGGRTFPCVELDLGTKRPGTDVYAIGAPARADLAFSLTRGIISGLRTKDGTQLIQTDASVSPGNSGGPLLDKQARVVGIVSSKLAGGAVEGISFGVAIEAALRALALEPGAATTAALLNADAAATAPKRREQAFMDTEDPLMPLVARPWAAAPRPRGRPTNFLRIGGIVVAGLGAAVAGLSYAEYAGSQRVSHADYDSFRAINDIGWAALGLGVAGFVASFWVNRAAPAASKKEIAQ